MGANKVKTGFTIGAKLGLLSPLYHLTSVPTALRAVNGYVHKKRNH